MYFIPLDHGAYFAHNGEGTSIAWPHRLMARTPRFQCGNRGSIPLGANYSSILTR